MVDIGLDNGRSPIARLATIASGGAGNAERIAAWARAFFDTPPLFGNGIGSASTLIGGAARYNTESFILNVYYEGGCS